MRHVERVVSRVLLWGGLLSIVAMTLGMGLYAKQPVGGVDVLRLRIVEHSVEDRAVPVFASLDGIAQGLGHRPVDPLAVTALGVVGLFLTPVAGVFVAILSFWSSGDRSYTLIATIVLAGLLLSFALGAAG